MWYVLNYITPAGQRRSALPGIIDRFNHIEGADLQLFAPTFIELSSQNGHVEKKEKPLLYHYVFISGPEPVVKRLCASVPGFSFILDRAGASRYLSVSDDTVAQFRIIARFYGNRLPCYPLEGISLEEGDLVQIVSGPFAGLTGRYISRKGGRSGNILVAVDGALAAVAYDVPADYVRVLEFARNTKRLYDQLDSFSSKVETFLDQGNSYDKAPLPLVAAANVFSTRLGSLKVNSPKTEARLAALLYAAYRITGDAARASEALERYKSLSHHITNPKTLSVLTRLLT